MSEWKGKLFSDAHGRGPESRGAEAKEKSKWNEIKHSQLVASFFVTGPAAGPLSLFDIQRWSQPANVEIDGCYAPSRSWTVANASWNEIGRERVQSHLHQEGKHVKSTRQEPRKKSNDEKWTNLRSLHKTFVFFYSSSSHYYLYHREWPENFLTLKIKKNYWFFLGQNHRKKGNPCLNSRGLLKNDLSPPLLNCLSTRTKNGSSSRWVTPP